MIHRWKKYQELLESRRRELCEELARKRAQIAIESSGGDLLERMRSFSERELAVRAVSRLSRLIADVEAALKRIHDGTYGACQACGRPIGAARLSAIPWCSLCIECQEAADRGELEAA
jgi:DnaK suppressor protein